jgi:hypothetical protein
MRISYLLKIMTEPIGTTGVQAMELAKEGAIYIVLGNLLISGWKRKGQERSLYMNRRD